MLKRLHIDKIILIESTDITFTGNFNVLSGETGSGKSAIMEAIDLIVGRKTEISLIRHGADKGVVEAAFETDRLPGLREILEEAEIEYEHGEELIIRRELHANGKSRSFVNHQSVRLTLLSKIGEELIHIVGPHANQRLLSTDHHRRILDLYGGLTSLVQTFAKAWEKEKKIETELRALIDSEPARLREIEVCRMEAEELKNARLKDGEDERLFEEYKQLIESEEIAEKVSEIERVLSGEKGAILPLLSKLSVPFEDLLRFDPSLTETIHSFRNTLIELQEISRTIGHYAGRFDCRPERTAEINDRLSLINRLKRKYGAGYEEMCAYLRKTEERLYELENADTRIEELRTALTEAQTKTTALARELSTGRQKGAKLLEKALIRELRALNMPEAGFQVEISTEPRDRSGDDKVEFYLLPNVGERRIPVKDYASGGELSRLMFSLQTILAGKEGLTLIFDEIDANIGGETATIFGRKLREIGERQQVLCITHFPQVARYADRHLQISKREQEGRTVTLVNSLDKEDERQTELDRMLGLVKK